MGKNIALRPDDRRLKAAITHCNKGHEFTPENTGWQRKHGKRFCRTCARQRDIDNRAADPEGTKERQRQTMAAWRAANPERSRKTWVKNRTRKKEWVQEYKRTLGCGLCPERHPVCLDFHHMDPALKDVNVSVALAHWSIERLEAEIQKCVVICSNCHRKLHWEERQTQTAC